MAAADFRSVLENLAGLRTDDGWTLTELVKKESFQTGGAFSLGYHALHDSGALGFAKVLDFSRAAEQRDTIRALQVMTESYNFERDILALCRKTRLSKIVVAISDGEIYLDGAPFDKVFYLIFELANGDVRKKAVESNAFDLTWTMRATHHIATGVMQLHSKEIYHQDLKPSNILVFGDGDISKLADLGRAHCSSIGAPHDHLIAPGARSYAPPEQLYGFSLPDNIHSRSSSDLYLMGSIIYFFFMGTMLTPSIASGLSDAHKPRFLSVNDGGWTGTYDDVLPYLLFSYEEVARHFEARASQAFSEAKIPDVGAKLINLFRYLTNPDPRLRGHPNERRLKYSNPYDMRMFVSTFASIAHACELRLERTDAA
ncbi:MAG: protein kinase [Phenylobacterium sp.]|nr:protein kinase [Phenylobacterium sp.]